MDLRSGSAHDLLEANNDQNHTHGSAPMNIPFLNLKAAYQELQAELDAACKKVMESGWYILGDEVEQFESEFASYCQAKHCIGVGNGLDALILILKGYGIGSGDEVIVPANTYIATWLAVSTVGATPVPVEPDPPTFNIDPARIEGAITSHTRAIMPVHLYGQPAAMENIREVARRRGLRLIEDAAQAQGATYAGAPTGNLGDAAGFSFYPGKNLGAFGDAGAIVTDDDNLADRIRMLRNYGSRKKYYNEIQGLNSRLDALQAAFLRIKLKRLDEWNSRRRSIARTYLAQLSEVPNLQLPVSEPNAESVWHLFVICHPDRDSLQRHLDNSGIGTLIHYPVPPHLSAAYQNGGWSAGDFPVTEGLSKSVLSLPMGPHLTPEDAGRVIESLRAFPN